MATFTRSCTGFATLAQAGGGPAVDWRTDGGRTDRAVALPDGTGLSERTSDVVGRTEVRFKDVVKVTHRFRLDKDNLAIRRNEFDAAVGTQGTYIEVGYLRLNRDVGGGITICIGINDDLSHTSLEYDPGFIIEPDNVVRAVFYGLGADAGNAADVARLVEEGRLARPEPGLVCLP